MKIYDISQEVFGSKVFPGDPAPGMQAVMRIAEGGKCNLSAFSMCAQSAIHCPEAESQPLRTPSPPPKRQPLFP